MQLLFELSIFVHQKEHDRTIAEYSTIGSPKKIAINVAYNTFPILFPTNVVVRNVSGLLFKKF